MEKLVGIILMAGLSTRFEGTTNKQLCLLNNKPVFSYSIDAFSNAGLSKLIVTVNPINKTDIEKYIYENHINATVIMGGQTRQESVENALNALSLEEDDIVVIHDGARPLVNDFIIKETAKAASVYGASTAYLESTNTIALKNESDEIVEFIKRDNVAQIQTPQAFKFGLIKKAHAASNDKNATDDCTLVMRLGNKIKLIKGYKALHKVTTKEDILYLEGLIKE